MNLGHAEGVGVVIYWDVFCGSRLLFSPSSPLPSSRIRMTVFGGTLTRSVLCVLLCFAGSSLGVPKGFPASGNGLWYKQPGKVWVNDYLPVGNGKLAGMFFELDRGVRAVD